MGRTPTGGGNLLDLYPIGSIFINPIITEYNDTFADAVISSSPALTALPAVLSKNLNKLFSPASVIGGTWEKLCNQKTPVEFIGGPIGTGAIPGLSNLQNSAYAYVNGMLRYNDFYNRGPAGGSSVTTTQYAITCMWIRIT